MHPIARAAAAAAFLVLAPALAAAADCRFTAQHDFDVDAAGLKTIAFDLGSSDLVVEGVPGLAKIEVRGKACASEQERLAELGVDQQRSGDRLTITPKPQRERRDGGLGSGYAYVDLRVRMPSALAADVHSRSGDADVHDVAALNFESSSGDLEVRRIAGALTTRATSGDVEGGDVGRVEVRGTGSGDVELDGVRGDVEVARAGSGDLAFDHVGGSVRIGSVGSGDVRLRRVGGAATVDSIGSGDVVVDGIGGDFTLRAKGSGDVSQHDVRGRVSLPNAPG
ncbi:MAG TPA: DUF2807 domain-containing protein [Dokdonella sp.]